MQALNSQFSHKLHSSDWFRNLLEDDARLEDLKETARLYFSEDDGSVTVNLIPAVIILGLLALGEDTRHVSRVSSDVTFVVNLV